MTFDGAINHDILVHVQTTSLQTLSDNSCDPDWLESRCKRCKTWSRIFCAFAGINSLQGGRFVLKFVAATVHCTHYIMYIWHLWLILDLHVHTHVMVFTLIYYLRFCDSQDTDCLTSRSDLSRFGCYKGGIHWLAMRSPPKQPNSNILVHVLIHTCVHMSCTIATALSHSLLYLGYVHDGLRFRNVAKGKPSVSFHHPLFPAPPTVSAPPTCALCPPPYKRRELSMLQTPPLRATRLPQLMLIM